MTTAEEGKAANKGVAITKSSGLERLFDPKFHYNQNESKIASLDDGWGKAALCFRTAGAIRIGHAQSLNARSLRELMAALDVWRNRYEAGNTLALLQAIELCANENVPLPTWLAQGFSRAMQSFFRPGEAHSLDLVFSDPNLPTNTPSKAAAARQDWRLGVELWSACWQLVTTDETISSLDAALESVLTSKDWGVKKRKARTLVTQVDENQSEHLQKREKQALARFLENRRKA